MNRFKNKQKFNYKKLKNMDKNLAVIIIVLGTSVVLPILLVFFNMRRKMDSEKNKKEIILAALEKNARQTPEGKIAE